MNREVFLKKQILDLYYEIDGAMKMMETYPSATDAEANGYWQGTYDARLEVLGELRRILIKHEALVKGRRNYNVNS